MKFCPPVCLLGLLLLIQSAAGDAETWEDIQKIETDLTFLDSLVSFVSAADLTAYSDILADAKELPEMRQAATIPVVMDQWARKDPQDLERKIMQRWDDLDEGVHRHYLQLALRLDTAKAARKIFDQEDPAFQYRDGLIYELIRLNPKLAAKHLSKSEDPDALSEWSTMLVNSWAEHSPKEALDWASDHLELVDLTQAFSSLVYSNNEDIKVKLAELWKTLPKEARTPELQKNVARQLLNSDPEAALKFIDGLPDEERYPLMERAMGQLAEAGSPKAAALLRSLPPEHLPNIYTVKKVLLEWGLREPEKALAWADEVADPEMREEALARINTVLGMLDPQLAVDQAMATPPGTLRRTLIRNTALLLVKKDLAEGLAWVDALPESAGKRLALESITHMADFIPPEKLLDEGLKMTPSQSVNDFIDRAFARWSTDNIVGASEWFLSLPESEQTRDRANNLGYKLATRAPEIGIEYLFSESTPMALRNNIMSDYIRKFGNRPEMRELLLNRIRPEHLGSVVRDVDLINLAVHSPMQAFELAQQMPDENKRQMIARLADRWAQFDPQGLAAYTQREEIDIRYHYANIARNLANRNYDQAAAWAEGLKEADHKHYATMGLALHRSNTAPSEGFTMLENSADKMTRATRHAHFQTYEKILERWAYFDPAAAQAALIKSSIPDRRKDRLRKAIENLDVAP